MNPEDSESPFDKLPSAGSVSSSGDVAATIRAARNMRVDSEITQDEVAEFSGKYRDILNHYREHSRECLDSGDYLQGAEKAWGAYAASIKAIAADYGLKISFHGSIISVASRLAALANRDDPNAGAVLRAGLNSARSLHQHSYENDLEPDVIRLSADDVDAAIDLMQQQFASGANGGGRPGSETPL